MGGRRKGDEGCPCPRTMNLRTILNSLAGNDSDLASLIRQGVKPPAMLPCNLYAARVHSLQAGPGVGKTTVALALCKILIEHQLKVIYVDYENGREPLADRCAALGMDADLVAKHFIYREQFDWVDERSFDRYMRKQRPSMVVIDSMTDALVANGVNEMSGHEVTAFMTKFITPIAHRHGSACLILDHLTKSSVGKSDERYARGSSVKLDQVDAAIRLELADKAQPFNRDHGTDLRCTVTKDRGGGLRLAELWRVEVDRGRITVRPAHEDG